MAELSLEIVNRLFLEARTFPKWQPIDVPDELLERVYDLAKMAPTGANTSPLRIVWIKSKLAKERLVPTLDAGNVAKVLSAPVTGILCVDGNFYEKLPVLFPHQPKAKAAFENNAQAADRTGRLNALLQCAYVIIAARSIGLDCGPMGGFNNAQVDEQFLAQSSWRSLLLLNIGYGDQTSLHPRLPRLSFQEACRIE